MQRAWGPAAVAVAMAVAGACSDGRESQPGATVPPGGDGAATSAPATTLPAQSYEVPEVIDEAYVQKVVSAYDQVLGDAIRILVRDQGVSEDFLEHLLAIYTEPEFDVHQRAWRETIAQGDLAKRPEKSGDPVTTVLTLIDATPTCVIARADRDLRATTTVEPEESPQDDYIVLVRKREGRDPAQVNPTPWVMSFDGFKNDNSVPRASCGD